MDYAHRSAVRRSSQAVRPFILLVLISASVWAQATNVFPASGNVGIGTTNPQHKLDVFGVIRWGTSGQGLLSWDASNNAYLQSPNGIALAPNNGGAAMFLNAAGKVGIGTTSPAADLDVGSFSANGTLRSVFARQNEGNSSGAGTFLGVRAWGTQVSNFGGKKFSIEDSFYGYTNAAINFYRGGSTTGGFIRFATNNGTEQMTIDPSGNVGIGTTAPQSKLAVNGTITTKEVVVTNTGWSDYVFKPDYRLAPLQEVAAYIREHGHLPEIPSETEVREQGVGVGEMQAKLLAKIEELTLHIIRAEERTFRLERQYRELEQENRGLRNQLMKLSQP